jgi:hypothetical protein
MLRAPRRDGRLRVQLAPHSEKALDLELGGVREKRLARPHLETVSASVLDHAVAPTKILRQVDANPPFVEGDPQAPSLLRLLAQSDRHFQDRERTDHERFHRSGDQSWLNGRAESAIDTPPFTVRGLAGSRPRGSPAVVNENKTPHRRPRLRHRMRCFLLGHSRRQTSLTGYASRCRRCRMLWRGPAGRLSAGDLAD